MNNKILIKQNRELFDKLQIANLNNKRLAAENRVLKEQVDFLKSQLIEITENDKPFEDIVETPITTESVQVVPQITEIELPADVEYGSKIIGEIVMSATFHSNKITTEKKDNLKELLNLILGRTEVAKAEILNIISSGVSFDTKCEMINKVRDESVEYFKSVIEQ